MTSSSLHVRADCSDGRYKDLHAGWSLDHLVSAPGLVPIIAARGPRADFITAFGPLRVSVKAHRASILSQIAGITHLKGAVQIRVYTHEQCGFYQEVLGIDPTLGELEEELDMAVSDIKKVVTSNVKVKGHVVHLDLEGDHSHWSVTRPMVMA